ncbi:MAG: hypothetical protein H6978_11685 [Gammaproteobacteria bacterium]|nr:hypothetical protein [Gammaproteobacteria bacterium]
MDNARLSLLTVSGATLIAATLLIVLGLDLGWVAQHKLETTLISGALLVTVATWGIWATFQRDENAADGVDRVLDSRKRELAYIERELLVREEMFARRWIRMETALDTPMSIDLLDSHLDDEALARLSERDREVLALIENEAKRAFDGVLANRYAAGDGVNVPLIMDDLHDFITRVARVYQPDATEPVLETNIELLAKAVSRACLHLLVSIERLPMDLQRYNLAKAYRQLRRAAHYYGKYRNIEPYLTHGMNLAHISRVALGASPIAVGVGWVAGKLARYGASTLAERLVNKQLVVLMHDFVKAIGFEVAIVYGGHFRYRDANFVFGVELVELESIRDDQAGTAAAMRTLAALSLRNEYDRIYLFRLLARRASATPARFRGAVTLTDVERQRIYGQLLKHAQDSGLDMSRPRVLRWQRDISRRLNVEVADEKALVVAG